MNKPWQKLHHCVPERLTCHYTFLHYPKILYMKTLFKPACHMHKKISSDAKPSHSLLLHPGTLRMSSYTSRIDSIEMDNLPLSWTINKSIQPQLWVGSFSSWSNHKQVDSNTITSQIVFIFLIFSHIQPLYHSSCISLHTTKQVDYYFFPHSSQVFPH